MCYKRNRDFREDKDNAQREIAKILNIQLIVYQRYERDGLLLSLYITLYFQF